jgi:peptidoglycan hydrolase-like protein with peptidoglycan-binding domain
VNARLIPLVATLVVVIPVAYVVRGASAMTVQQMAEMGDPETAALQVGLREHGLYVGTTDGILGPRTRGALRRLQRRAGLPADGLPTPATRALLGAYGRKAPLGARMLHTGMRGWDVAALQFSLAWHGFPSGLLDGRFGSHTDSALRRFQAWSGLVADGAAGPATLVKLRVAPPRPQIVLARPVHAPVGDGFGPRGDRFHAGVDYLARFGARVAAAASGRVRFAGWTSGWGKTVIVGHRAGVRTLYAHLSRISVRVGQRVATGSLLGRVGMTGHATGPHLHFEVHIRGAAVDPLADSSR